MQTQKKCFVVMGFGKKTDLATGRKLDLDKTYHAMIKPVIEAKGISCVRADEILHSGSIDLAMYQQLLTADIVVADLSTANLNSFYELGIRHALRPRTTIVMSEDQLCYPFDVNHILINKYTHLGDSIDYFEVLRFQKHLAAMIDAVLADEKPDSPVYTYLDDLVPPALKAKAEAVAQQVNRALSDSQQDTDNKSKQGETNTTLSVLIKQGEEAMASKNYPAAKVLFESALQLVKCTPQEEVSSSNAYIIHRLALATYRSELPTHEDALKEANALLDQLDLSHTNDSETVGLAGAIEKKLYESGFGEDHLVDAIQFFQRGFYLLHNRYNGINLAYLLNCRAQSTLDTTEEERIADRVWANRIRKDVLRMCEKDWDQVQKRETRMAQSLLNDAAQELSQMYQGNENEQKFWILVNKAEAYLGLGQLDDYENARKEAEEIDHEPWMMRSFMDQAKRLEKLLPRMPMEV